MLTGLRPPPTGCSAGTDRLDHRRVEELSPDALIEKMRAARECRAIEGAPAADWLARLEAIRRRGE